MDTCHGNASGKGPVCQPRRDMRLRFDPCVGERDPLDLQDSCLEIPMNRGARQATVDRVSKTKTKAKRLSTHAQIYRLYNIKSKPQCDMSWGQYRISVVTKVPLCWGMLIMEETMQVCG